MNLSGLRKLYKVWTSAKAGLLARRWNGRMVSGNYMGAATPPLKRPVYEGYAGRVARGGASTAALCCRYAAAFSLGLASLALQACPPRPPPRGRSARHATSPRAPSGSDAPAPACRRCPRRHLVSQFAAKNRPLGETLGFALVGWTLVYLGGACLDGRTAPEEEEEEKKKA